MVEAKDVMPSLLSTFPEFNREWQDYLNSDMYGPDEPYNDIAQLATFLVDRIEIRETDGFDRLFRAVEELLQEATPSVRELITVGLLEGIQNVSLSRSVSLESWESWLGPLTSEAWRNVIEFGTAT
jgi:hypothetical protein